MPKNPSLKAGVTDKTYMDRLPEALLDAFSTNDRINHYLIDNLPPEAWKAKPPTARDAPSPPSSPTCTTCA